MKTEIFQKELENKIKTGSYRKLRSLNNSGKFVEIGNKRLINFSSNDYLGIGANKKNWLDFLEKEKNKIFGGGSCSSRLLTGNNFDIEELEQKISTAYGSEAALIFNSGYHVNTGLLPTISNKKDLILADKQVHASIIDGIRLSRAKYLRYNHLDYEHLEYLLSKNTEEYNNIFIVSESIYSMDGDIVNLKKLIELKEKYNATLYIDEAHSFGTRGENGLGYCQEKNVIDKIDFIVGTFGKAYAGVGAFVTCSKLIQNYLINNMRSLIFTTALPPISVRWANYIFDKMPLLDEQRKKLTKLSNLLRNGINSLGYKTLGKSHIIPLIIGESEETLKLSKYLFDNNILALPIRPPSVAPNTSRIRFSLSAAIDENDINLLINILSKYK